LEKKLKIVIAGIGGVGGYFGGMLSKHYEGNDAIQIIFFARGEHLRAINTKGLKIIQGENEFVTNPFLATDNPQEIGECDLILFCTKSYDFEGVVNQLRPCIGKHTILLSLLNGVDSQERLHTLVPGATIYGGCVYIVSQIQQTGVIAKSGSLEKLIFGCDQVTEQTNYLQEIFKAANIDSSISNNINSDIWEKFHLVGANSTATSYFNNSTGEILADNSKRDFLFSLLQELNALALKKGIVFNKNVVEETIKKLKSFPFANTSSMHRDFLKHNGRTELETITGYVVREGNRFNIPVTSFERAYTALKEQALNENPVQ
jgi:2-dehydropantoate 2-reductase